MIRLFKPNPPEELTEEVKRELTELFKREKKAVWKKKYIAKTLLEMSNEKCVFCECKLQEEGKYMQVEHFYPKDLYEDEVMDWNNLLPICGRCNPIKNDHDTKAEPIINPTEMDPKEHLYIYNLLLFGKSELGDLTIDVLDLNNTIGIVQPRFLVATEVLKKLEGILVETNEYNPTNSNKRKESRLKNKMRAIYQEALPISEYSAIVSTIIFSYPNYNRIKSNMQVKGLWDSNLDHLESEAFSIKLEMPLEQEIN